MRVNNDFYEADEPIEDVIMAFQQAEKGRTRRPTQGRTEYLMIQGLLQASGAVEFGNTVHLVAS